jgi:hypothetical protein
VTPDLVRGSYAVDLLAKVLDRIGRDEDPVAKCGALLEGLGVALAVTLVWMPIVWHWKRRKEAGSGAFGVG